MTRNLRTDKIQKTFALRFVSAVLVLAFTTTGLQPPAYAAKPAAPAPVRSWNLKSISLPPTLGDVREIYEGKSQVPVILVQDAHSIADAQKNIQKIIGYFQKNYGVSEIALEGAASELDAQFFKSFPDRDIFKKTLNVYADKGEVAGGVLAALLNPETSVYRGIEDWKLYEEGLALYAAAMQQEPAVAAEVSKLKENLQSRKKESYSPQLLEADALTEGFSRGEKDFGEVLRGLAKIKAPEKGSDLSVLTEMLQKTDPDVVSQTKEALEMAESFESKISRMEGTRLFEDFENYVESVKNSLLTGEEQKKINAESHRLLLLEKLSRLELNKDSWKEIKTAFSGQRTEKQETAQGFNVKLLKHHFDFYLNAEKRDQAFFQRLLKIHDAARPVLFVSGGFHTPAIAEKLKAEKISYLTIAPSIDTEVNENAYHEQMKGEVSWKKYFENENKKKSAGLAFTRALRDELLKAGAIHELPLLKTWRDQLIRDLVQNEKAGEAHQYLKFLDEVADKTSQNALTQKWHANIDAFLKKMDALKSRNELTVPNVSKLLKPAGNILPYRTSPAVLTRSVLSGIPRGLGPKSELRVPVIESRRQKQRDFYQELHRKFMDYQPSVTDDGKKTVFDPKLLAASRNNFEIQDGRWVPKPSDIHALYIRTDTDLGEYLDKIVDEIVEALDPDQVYYRLPKKNRHVSVFVPQSIRPAEFGKPGSEEKKIPAADMHRLKAMLRMQIKKIAPYRLNFAGIRINPEDGGIIAVFEDDGQTEEISKTLAKEGSLITSVISPKKYRRTIVHMTLLMLLEDISSEALERLKKIQKKYNGLNEEIGQSVTSMRFGHETRWMQSDFESGSRRFYPLARSETRTALTEADLANLKAAIGNMAEVESTRETKDYVPLRRAMEVVKPVLLALNENFRTISDLHFRDVAIWSLDYEPDRVLAAQKITSPKGEFKFNLRKKKYGSFKYEENEIEAADMTKFVYQLNVLVRRELNIKEEEIAPFWISAGQKDPGKIKFNLSLPKLTGNKDADLSVELLPGSGAAFAAVFLTFFILAKAEKEKPAEPVRSSPADYSGAIIWTIAIIALLALGVLFAGDLWQLFRRPSAPDVEGSVKPVEFRTQKLKALDGFRPEDLHEFNPPVFIMTPFKPGDERVRIEKNILRMKNDPELGPLRIEIIPENLDSFIPLKDSLTFAMDYQGEVKPRVEPVIRIHFATREGRIKKEWTEYYIVPVSKETRAFTIPDLKEHLQRGDVKQITIKIPEDAAADYGFHFKGGLSFHIARRSELREPLQRAISEMEEFVKDPKNSNLPKNYKFVNSLGFAVLKRELSEKMFKYAPLRLPGDYQRWREQFNQRFREEYLPSIQTSGVLSNLEKDCLSFSRKNDAINRKEPVYGIVPAVLGGMAASDRAKASSISGLLIDRLLKSVFETEGRQPLEKTYSVRKKMHTSVRKLLKRRPDLEPKLTAIIENVFDIFEDEFKGSLGLFAFAFVFVYHVGEWTYVLNSRLSNLGDALLGEWVMMQMQKTFAHGPDSYVAPAFAHRFYDSFVSNKTLVKIADGMEISKFLVNDFAIDGTMKANSLEAIIAAIYLLRGWDALDQTLQRFYAIYGPIVRSEMRATQLQVGKNRQFSVRYPGIEEEIIVTYLGTDQDKKTSAFSVYLPKPNSFIMWNRVSKTERRQLQGPQVIRVPEKGRLEIKKRKMKKTDETIRISVSKADEESGLIDVSMGEVARLDDRIKAKKIRLTSGEIVNADPSKVRFGWFDGSLLYNFETKERYSMGPGPDFIYHLVEAQKTDTAAQPDLLPEFIKELGDLRDLINRTLRKKGSSYVRNLQTVMRSLNSGDVAAIEEATGTLEKTGESFRSVPALQSEVSKVRNLVARIKKWSWPKRRDAQRSEMRAPLQQAILEMEEFISSYRGPAVRYKLAKSLGDEIWKREILERLFMRVPFSSPKKYQFWRDVFTNFFVDEDLPFIDESNVLNNLDRHPAIFAWENGPVDISDPIYGAVPAVLGLIAVSDRKKASEIAGLMIDDLVEALFAYEPKFTAKDIMDLELKLLLGSRPDLEPELDAVAEKLPKIFGGEFEDSSKTLRFPFVISYHNKGNTVIPNASLSTLGDSLLGEWGMRQFQKNHAGEKSPRFNKNSFETLVSNKALDAIAKGLGLGELLISNGQMGRESRTNSLEAVFAAVYLLHGWDALDRMLQNFYARVFLGEREEFDLAKILERIPRAARSELRSPEFVKIYQTGSHNYWLELSIEERKTEGPEKKYYLTIAPSYSPDSDAVQSGQSGSAKWASETVLLKSLTAGDAAETLQKIKKELEDKSAGWESAHGDEYKAFIDWVRSNYGAEWTLGQFKAAFISTVLAFLIGFLIYFFTVQHEFSKNAGELEKFRNASELMAANPDMFGPMASLLDSGNREMRMTAAARLKEYQGKETLAVLFVLRRRLGKEEDKEVAKKIRETVEVLRQRLPANNPRSELRTFNRDLELEPQISFKPAVLNRAAEKNSLQLLNSWDRETAAKLLDNFIEKYSDAGGTPEAKDEGLYFRANFQRMWRRVIEIAAYFSQPDYVENLILEAAKIPRWRVDARLVPTDSGHDLFLAVQQLRELLPGINAVNNIHPLTSLFWGVVLLIAVLVVATNLSPLIHSPQTQQQIEANARFKKWQAKIRKQQRAILMTAEGKADVLVRHEQAWENFEELAEQLKEERAIKELLEILQTDPFEAHRERYPGIIAGIYKDTEFSAQAKRGLERALKREESQPVRKAISKALEELKKPARSELRAEDPVRELVAAIKGRLAEPPAPRGEELLGMVTAWLKSKLEKDAAGFRKKVTVEIWNKLFSPPVLRALFLADLEQKEAIQRFFLQHVTSGKEDRHLRNLWAQIKPAIQRTQTALAAFKADFQELPDPLLAKPLAYGQREKFNDIYKVTEYPDTRDFVPVLGVAANVPKAEAMLKMARVMMELNEKLAAAAEGLIRKGDKNDVTFLTPYEDERILENFKSGSPSLEMIVKCYRLISGRDRHHLLGWLEKILSKTHVDEFKAAMDAKDTEAFLDRVTDDEVRNRFFQTRRLFVDLFMVFHVYDIKYSYQRVWEETEIFHGGDKKLKETYIFPDLYEVLRENYSLVAAGNRLSWPGTPEGKGFIEAMRRINPDFRVVLLAEYNWPRDQVSYLVNDERAVMIENRAKSIGRRLGRKLSQEDEQQFDLAEGGAVLHGAMTNGQLFAVISSSVAEDMRRALAWKLKEEGKNIRLYSLPPGLITHEIDGRNYRIDVGHHIDLSLNFVPSEFTEDGRTKIVVDPFYYKGVKNLPEFQRMLKDGGFREEDIFEIPQEYAHFNYANFALIRTGNFIEGKPERKILFNAGAKFLAQELKLKDGTYEILPEPLTGLSWSDGLLRCATQDFDSSELFAVRTQIQQDGIGGAAVRSMEAMLQNDERLRDLMKEAASYGLEKLSAPPGPAFSAKMKVTLNAATIEIPPGLSGPEELKNYLERGLLEILAELKNFWGDLPLVSRYFFRSEMRNEQSQEPALDKAIYEEYRSRMIKYLDVDNNSAFTDHFKKRRGVYLGQLGRMRIPNSDTVIQEFTHHMWIVFKQRINTIHETYQPKQVSHTPEMYLNSMIHNTWKDFLRSKASQDRKFQQLSKYTNEEGQETESGEKSDYRGRSVPDTLTEVLHAERGERIHKLYLLIMDFLRTLPEGQRKVFEARHIALEDVKTVAAKFGMTEIAVTQADFRAKEAIRKKFKMDFEEIVGLLGRRSEMRNARTGQHDLSHLIQQAKDFYNWRVRDQEPGEGFVILRRSVGSDYDVTVTVYPDGWSVLIHPFELLGDGFFQMSWRKQKNGDFQLLLYDRSGETTLLPGFEQHNPLYSWAWSPGNNETEPTTGMHFSMVMDETLAQLLPKAITSYGKPEGRIRGQGPISWKIDFVKRRESRSEMRAALGVVKDWAEAEALIREHLTGEGKNLHSVSIIKESGSRYNSETLIAHGGRPGIPAMMAKLMGMIERDVKFPAQWEIVKSRLKITNYEMVNLVIRSSGQMVKEENADFLGYSFEPVASQLAPGLSIGDRITLIMKERGITSRKKLAELYQEQTGQAWQSGSMTYFFRTKGLPKKEAIKKFFVVAKILKVDPFLLIFGKTSKREIFEGKTVAEKIKMLRVRRGWYEEELVKELLKTGETMGVKIFKTDNEDSQRSVVKNWETTTNVPEPASRPVVEKTLEYEDLFYPAEIKKIINTMLDLAKNGDPAFFDRAEDLVKTLESWMARHPAKSYKFLAVWVYDRLQEAMTSYTPLEKQNERWNSLISRVQHFRVQQSETAGVRSEMRAESGTVNSPEEAEALIREYLTGDGEEKDLYRVSIRRKTRELGLFRGRVLGAYNGQRGVSAMLRELMEMVRQDVNFPATWKIEVKPFVGNFNETNLLITSSQNPPAEGSARSELRGLNPEIINILKKKYRNKAEWIKLLAYWAGKVDEGFPKTTFNVAAASGGAATSDQVIFAIHNKKISYAEVGMVRRGKGRPLLTEIFRPGATDEISEQGFVNILQKDKKDQTDWMVLLRFWASLVEEGTPRTRKNVAKVSGGEVSEGEIEKILRKFGISYEDAGIEKGKPGRLGKDAREKLVAEVLAKKIKIKKDWILLLKYWAGKVARNKLRTPTNVAAVSGGTVHSKRIEQILVQYEISYDEVKMLKEESKETWLIYFKKLVQELPAGIEPTIKNLAKHSSDKVSENTLWGAMSKHKISYEEAGIKRQRAKKRTRAEWIVYLGDLIKKLDKDSPATLENIAAVSDGELKKRDIQFAMTNHEIGYKEMKIIPPGEEAPGQKRSEMRSFEQIDDKYGVRFDTNVYAYKDRVLTGVLNAADPAIRAGLIAVEAGEARHQKIVQAIKNAGFENVLYPQTSGQVILMTEKLFLAPLRVAQSLLLTAAFYSAIQELNPEEYEHMLRVTDRFFQKFMTEVEAGQLEPESLVPNMLAATLTGATMMLASGNFRESDFLMRGHQLLVRIETSWTTRYENYLKIWKQKKSYVDMLNESLEGELAARGVTLIQLQGAGDAQIPLDSAQGKEILRQVQMLAREYSIPFDISINGPVVYIAQARSELRSTEEKETRGDLAFTQAIRNLDIRYYDYIKVLHVVRLAVLRLSNSVKEKEEKRKIWLNETLRKFVEQQRKLHPPGPDEWLLLEGIGQTKRDQDLKEYLAALFERNEAHQYSNLWLIKHLREKSEGLNLDVEEGRLSIAKSYRETVKKNIAAQFEALASEKADAFTRSMAVVSLAQLVEQGFAEELRAALREMISEDFKLPGGIQKSFSFKQINEIDKARRSEMRSLIAGWDGEEVETPEDEAFAEAVQNLEVVDLDAELIRFPEGIKVLHILREVIGDLRRSYSYSIDRKIKIGVEFRGLIEQQKAKHPGERDEELLLRGIEETKHDGQLQEHLNILFKRDRDTGELVNLWIIQYLREHAMYQDFEVPTAGAESSEWTNIKVLKLDIKKKRLSVTVEYQRFIEQQIRLYLDTLLKGHFDKDDLVAPLDQLVMSRSRAQGSSGYHVAYEKLKEMAENGFFQAISLIIQMKRERGQFPRKGQFPPEMKEFFLDKDILEINRIAGRSRSELRVTKKWSSEEIESGTPWKKWLKGIKPGYARLKDRLLIYLFIRSLFLTDEDPFAPFVDMDRAYMRAFFGLPEKGIPDIEATNAILLQLEQILKREKLETWYGDLNFWVVLSNYTTTEDSIRDASQRLRLLNNAFHLLFHDIFAISTHVRPASRVKQTHLHEIDDEILAGHTPLFAAHLLSRAEDAELKAEAAERKAEPEIEKMPLRIAYLWVLASGLDRSIYLPVYWNKIKEDFKNLKDPVTGKPIPSAQVGALIQEILDTPWEKYNLTFPWNAIRNYPEHDDEWVPHENPLDTIDTGFWSRFENLFLRLMERRYAVDKRSGYDPEEIPGRKQAFEEGLQEINQSLRSEMRRHQNFIRPVTLAMMPGKKVSGIIDDQAIAELIGGFERSRSGLRAKLAVEAEILYQEAVRKVLTRYESKAGRRHGTVAIAVPDGFNNEFMDGFAKGLSGVEKLLIDGKLSHPATKMLQPFVHTQPAELSRKNILDEGIIPAAVLFRKNRIDEKYFCLDITDIKKLDSNASRWLGTRVGEAMAGVSQMQNLSRSELREELARKLGELVQLARGGNSFAVDSAQAQLLFDAQVLRALAAAA